MEAFKYYMLNNFDRDLLSLLETNSIISITDSLGRIEYVNDNFCNTLECDERELLGETLKLLKSPLHSDLLYKKLWSLVFYKNYLFFLVFFQKQHQSLLELFSNA